MAWLKVSPPRMGWDDCVRQWRERRGASTPGGAALPARRKGPWGGSFHKKRLELGIAGRLYLLVALFGLGCMALATTLIWLQSQQAFKARKLHLQQLVAAAHGVLAAHKALADAGEMRVEVAKKRALTVIGTMWFGKADYFTARSLDGTSVARWRGGETTRARTLRCG